MATLQSVTLEFSSGSTSGVKKAVVGYTINFDAADVGKKFRVGIKLWADDSGEEVGGVFPLNPLYTFQFGPFYSRRDYFIITPSAAGPFSGTKDAEVAVDVLNEDPGTIEFYPGKKFPKPDEIYARASLLPVGDEQSQRSETKSLLLL